MGKTTWTKEMHDQLRDLYPNHHNMDIAKKMGISESRIKARAKVLKLRKVGKHKVRTSPYLHIDIEEFKRLYPVTTIKKMIQIFGGSKSGIMSLAREHKLKRKDNPGQFKKGCDSWNAGKRGIRVSPKSEFKKGSLPGNTLYNGAITLRNHRSVKTGKPYPTLYIRLSKAQWQPLQRYIWEKHNGPIPKKHCVVFKDGNSLHCDIDNLECISMAENARRNQNYEKAAQSIRANWDEGISDHQVASYLVGADKQLQQYIIDHRPDIISLKRQQLQLNRTLKQKTDG